MKIEKKLRELFYLLFDAGRKGVNKKKIYSKFGKEDVEKILHLADSRSLTSKIEEVGKKKDSFALSRYGVEYVYQLRRDELLETQTKILEKQIDVMDSQTKFSKLLVQATLVLAIAAFLEVLFYIVSKDFTLNFETWGNAIAIILLMVLAVWLMGIMVEIIVSIISKKFKFN